MGVAGQRVRAAIGPLEDPSSKLEDFYSSARKWVDLYDPDDPKKRDLTEWARSVESHGPTPKILYASGDDVAEALDQVPGSTVTINCIVCHSQWRLIVLEILG